MRRAYVGFALLLATLSPARADEPFVPRWVSGDLHVHTIHSHDVWSGPDDDNTETDEAYTFGWAVGEQIAIAQARGLDFLAITDHNDVRASREDAFREAPITMLPAYENSLGGHAQMLGATDCYEPEPNPDADPADCRRQGDADWATRSRDAIRADGGAFQINHPYDGDWASRVGHDVVPDSVEVWNIGPWHYQPPMPAAADNDASLAFWETFLDAGHRVAATGGSDNHWRSTTAAQGVGQPTTWVYVTSPGAQGVIDGIKAGRTSIAAEPPAHGGVRLDVTVDADGDGSFESLPGGTVPAGAAVRISALAPPGSFYRVVSRSGQSGGEGVIQPALPEVVTTVPDARWFYVELRIADAKDPRRMTCEPVVGGQTSYCRNRLGMRAMSSTIYVGS